MIVIEDLLATPRRQYAAQPEMDPLTEADALQEAQLLDFRVDALYSIAGFLFDLRTALQLRSANTGVLIVRGLRELKWTAAEQATRKTAWNIMGSFPSRRASLFLLCLGINTDARLEIAAMHAEFYSGDVPGLGDAPPSYGDHDSAVHDMLARWNSRFSPVHAVFVDPLV